MAEQGSHCYFLEQARHNLRRNHIAAVFEQLDLRAMGIRGTEGERILAETVGNDYGNRCGSRFDSLFRGGRGVCGLLRSLSRSGPSFDYKGTFFLETLN